MFREGPSVPCERVAYGDIWFLTETGAKSVVVARVSKDILESCILLTVLVKHFMTSSLISKTENVILPYFETPFFGINSNYCFPSQAL